MENSKILVMLAVIGLLGACKKNDTSQKFNVNTPVYEVQLNQDYNQAKLFQLALSTKSTQKVLQSIMNTSSTSDSIYNNMMYCRNDSLFSQHFYIFCIDMMQNSGMMSNSSGMMGGSNGGMMGNGGSMGNTNNTNSMIAYMNSLHSSVNLSTNTDYHRIDSLMHNQLTMCNMMTNKTVGVDNIYVNMQGLRKTHK